MYLASWGRAVRPPHIASANVGVLGLVLELIFILKCLVAPRGTTGRRSDEGRTY